MLTLLIHNLISSKKYYDRFIAKMTMNGNHLPLVAVALKPQLIETHKKIPMTMYDRTMDIVIFPDEIIQKSLWWCSRDQNCNASTIAMYYPHGTNAWNILRYLDQLHKVGFDSLINDMLNIEP